MHTGPLYLEFDIMPIQTERVRMAMNYFIYASSSSAPSLVREALRDNLNLPCQKNAQAPTWWISIQKVVDSWGMEIPQMLTIDGLQWSEAEAGASIKDEQITLSTMKDSLKKILAKAEHQRLKTELVSLPRFLLFVEKEATRGFKSYLVTLPHKERTLLTRLRFSNYHLGIQMGRYTNPKIDPQGKCICRLCPMIIVDSFVHMLGSCNGDPGITEASQN